MITQEQIKQSILILDNYKKCFGHELIPTQKNALDLALQLSKAPVPCMSSNNASNPLLNYANERALGLWELSWDELVHMPGNQTAEPGDRNARQQFLDKVREQGFVDDYAGIRISSSGRLFKIKNAKVWNLLGSNEEYLGQAATFKQWEYI
ncbi:MAG: hypothetical protein ACI9CF_000656 [Candidatus Omnitrophota bacterium]|jgi:hypothetical protein